MCYCPTPTLHLNLALTGDGAFIFSLKKTHSVWFISVLNYGDTENVLINHLLLVIPMSYPCHYTNLCPHKPHKHAHTHTHTHTHTLTQYGQFLMSNSPIRHVFGLWGNWSTRRKPTQTTCKLPRERNPGSAGSRIRNFLDVRQQCYPLSRAAQITIYH